MSAPIAFPPPPPTSNTLSSQQRSALVRSAKKLSKILGDVPRVLDDTPPLPSSSVPALTRTRTSPVPRDTESTWRKRKPTHLPPLFNPPTPSIDAPDAPSSPRGRTYYHPPPRRGSVLSIAPSIVSNAPSTASASSFSSASSDASQRRLKIEHLRRKLGNEVPDTAVFPTTPLTAIPAPHTPKTSTPRGRTRSRSRSRSRPVARLPSQTDDARSLAFSISSDESVHTVTFTAARVHSPRPHRSKHVYLTGPLPPVPPIPAHLVSSSSRRAANDDDHDTGLIRPRLKMAAGSKIGGSDFKAARRAKREGRAQNGMAEPGELIEMVGFLRF